MIFFVNISTQFVPVNNSYLLNYFGYAIDYYGNIGFPAIQLVWTDRNHKLPWEADFEEHFTDKQPSLDRNVDFKFHETRNLVVFTTRQWLKKNKPILKVVHDYNGDWQFLTGDQILSDARLIALEELIKQDVTLNEVFNLNYGEEAERSFIGDVWRRSVCEESD